MSPRRWRSDDDIDWYNVVLTAFDHEGAVHASPNNSTVAAPRGSFFLVRRRHATDKADVGSGPEDVPSAGSKGVDAVGLGNDVPDSASKGVDESGPVDEDEPQEEHVSQEHYSKSSPKVRGEKKNGQPPLNKSKSQYKRKTSVNKQKAQAIDLEESDHERSPPSSRFSKRMKQQLQNSPSVYSQKVQEVVLLDDEYLKPKEPKRNKEEVNREMSDRLNEPKIYYPSRDDQEAIDLTKSDIKCLDPKAFLSSPVINFYIKYIERTRLCNETFRGKFYIFNTYFFGKLEKAMHQPNGFPKLRRWWKDDNIFNNAYIILPIHGREHWSLVIICLPPKGRTSELIILHLDSLEVHCSAKILNTVGSYIEKEWRFLSVSEPTWPCLLSNIRKETVKVPQQNNAYDCGVFMLYYIEQFIKEAPPRFTSDKLDMFNRRWFKPEEASGLRQRIRELLLEEFERARLDDAISEADASEGYENIKEGELEADHSSKMVIEEGGGLGNSVESNGGIKVAASEKVSGESRDDFKSTGGINVAESDEASGELGDTCKTNKGIKVLASEEASGESGYPATIKAEKSAPAFTDVAVLNKGPTSSNKCNEKNAGCVVSAAASRSDIVKDRKGTVKADSGSSKAKKEGKSNAIASPERLKGNEEVIGNIPILDGVSDSGVKRSEGNEEAIGSTSMPAPNAVFETTGAKVWVTGICRPRPFPPGHWSRSSGGSSKDARRKFMEEFSRKK